MPQTSYTNADLARFQRQPLGITLEQQPAPEDQLAALSASSAPEPGYEEIMRGAHDALDSANRFSAGIDQDVADEQAQQAASAAALAHSNDVGSVTDSAATRLGRLARRGGSALLTSAKILAPFAIPEVALPLMAGKSAIDMYQGGTTRLKEHPVLSALDAATILGGAGAGARTIGNVRSALTGAFEASAAEDAAMSAAGEAARNRAYARQYPNLNVGEPTTISSARNVNYSGVPPVNKLDAGLSGLMKIVSPGEDAAFDAYARGVSSNEDPLAAFARGPQILSGQGTRTPEVAALFERAMGGRPVENMNASVADTVGAAKPVAGNGSPLFSGKVPMTNPPQGNGSPLFSGKIAMQPPAGNGSPLFTGKVPMGGQNASLAALEEEAAPVVTSRAANGSGESDFSQEVNNRMRSMTSNGKRFVVIKRGGQVQELLQSQARDYVPKAGEAYGVLDAKGGFTPEQFGQGGQSSMLQYAAKNGRK